MLQYHTSEFIAKIPGIFGSNFTYDNIVSVFTEWEFAHYSANHITSLLIVTLHHIDVINYDITWRHGDLFYLLEYVTPTEIFQVGDHKKKHSGI